MKLKNTLGVVIGSLVGSLSLGALAQGQGAVEAEIFGNRYFTDTTRGYNGDEGNLLGGSLGYFLTEDVELALSYGQYHDIRTDVTNKDIKGDNGALTALYHFGQPGPGLRPYVSAGVGHQSIGQEASGRDRTTQGILGAGLKYYFTEHFYARGGVDGLYNFDRGDSEWMAGVGVGVNFGGAQPVPPAEPVAEVCADSDNDGVCDNVDKCPDTPANVTVDADGCPAAAENVRVELDVKFDFDKSKVKEESYGDIKNLADFMTQYPSTTTTVEGHTDSVGTDAYNQKLSERRANAVKDVLVNQYSVGGERIESVGYGESRPVADNATSEGRAVNRRVEAEVEAQPK
ncbi:OmpA family protein [Pseudomonas sp. LS44]|uniref:OmpA family protein n=1 Tax=Pseudomonas sp. LS44 TaxID=1357074 RepID=UPI00215B74C1|nr:OmpA family protein [Pseudomonas sp. LS44]UVE19447.1 OmpA family protein [Pseudomonas sp. LS44]